MYQVIKRFAEVVPRKANTVRLVGEEIRWRLVGERRELVGQVLQMSGFRMPHKRQVILIDKDRSTIRNVLGSIRGLRIVDGALFGDIKWASCQLSRDTAAKWVQRHLEFIELEISPLAMKVEKSWLGVPGPIHVATHWTTVAAVVRGAAGALD